MNVRGFCKLVLVLFRAPASLEGGHVGHAGVGVVSPQVLLLLCLLLLLLVFFFFLNFSSLVGFSDVICLLLVVVWFIL